MGGPHSLRMFIYYYRVILYILKTFLLFLYAYFTRFKNVFSIFLNVQLLIFPAVALVVLFFIIAVENFK